MNTMRKLLLGSGIMLMFLIDLNGQLPSLLLLSDDSLHRKSNAMVLASADGRLGSNAVDIRFMKKLLLGGHIESQEINDLAESMGNQNRAGYQASGEVSFFNFRDTLFVNPIWGLKATVGTNYQGAASFSPKLFSSIFQGNAPLAGDTLELGPCSLQTQAWQKFGMGIFNKRTLSGITVSLVEGQSFQSLILQQADMYTSLAGDTVLFAPGGDYWRSDTTRRGWANGSGIGVALDLDYNLPLQNDMGIISVAVRDLGFVKWNSSSEQYALNHQAVWTGLDVNPWLQNHDDTLSKPNAEDSVVTKRRQGAFVAPLPLGVHLRYMKRFGKNNYYEAGWSIWPNRAAVPQLYAGVSHSFSNHLMVSGRLSLGGYARWGMGAEVQWMPCGTWIFRAGTNAMGGLVFAAAHGRDGYVSIGRSF